MNNQEPADNSGHEQDKAGGVNLKLFYGIVVLALVAAMAIAALIVMPFYQRR